MIEKWECPYCENHKEKHSEEVEFADGELVADVTCVSVHVMRDDGYGVALTHKEFEKLIKMYKETRNKL